MASEELISDAVLWAVTCRAHEARRSDRILDDPFASHLATIRAEDMFGAKADGAAAFVLAVGVATIDEVLQHAVRDHHIHSVAALGAGLDTRPYRLDLPNDLRWIEADRDAVLDYKALRLAHASPHCRVSHRSVELSDPGRRRVGLCEVARGVKRGLVLTEGLLSAFGREALDDLIDCVPPAFKCWIVDMIAPAWYVSPDGGGRSEQGVEPRVPAEEAVEAFARHRWRPTEFRPLMAQAFRFDEARAVGLSVTHPPGELEGIWLFQRAPRVEA